MGVHHFFSLPHSSTLVSPVVQSGGARGVEEPAVILLRSTMLMTCSNLLSSSRRRRVPTCRDQFSAPWFSHSGERKEGAVRRGGEGPCLAGLQRNRDASKPPPASSQLGRALHSPPCLVSPSSSFCFRGWWRNRTEKNGAALFESRTDERLYSRRPSLFAEDTGTRTSDGIHSLSGVVCHAEEVAGRLSIFSVSYHLRNSSPFLRSFFSTYAGKGLVLDSARKSPGPQACDKSQDHARTSSFPRTNVSSSTMSFTIPGVTFSSSSSSSTYASVRPAPLCVPGGGDQDVACNRTQGPVARKDTGKCGTVRDATSPPPTSSSSSLASTLSSCESQLYPFIVEDIRTGLSSPPRRMRFMSLLSPPPQTLEQQQKVASFLFEELRLRYAGQVGALQVLGTILNQAEHRLRRLRKLGGEGAQVGPTEGNLFDEQELYSRHDDRRCSSKARELEGRSRADSPLQLHGLLRVAQDTLLQQYELLSPNIGSRSVGSTTSAETSCVQPKSLATMSTWGGGGGPKRSWRGKSSGSRAATGDVSDCYD